MTFQPTPSNLKRILSLKKTQTKNKENVSTFKAMTLVRDEQGRWSAASLTIKGKVVETVELTKFDLLTYTLARANGLLRQCVLDLKKT